ncbi:group II intron reverse transcriptase/maturase [Exilibacterium tricleocarpae]|uniref:group II intron reverse transcriptase/maturase n=1 Tax=Exilibacterium tricleocarpae TaxID=2591008 RepID=UPI001FE39BF6|nr:group II intron reverse transcriptase/maturase [Exilibacterium tricleocarpae]
MPYLNSDTAPNGASVDQRSAGSNAFNLELFDAVFAASNVARAWQQVRANKGAPGIDNMTVEAFPAWAKGHWQTLKTQTLAGTYRPQPVKRVEIDKPNGGKRQLGIPTVIDRVIQQAIVQILSPMIDPTFSENSFGFRPQRSAHQAVKQVQQIIKQQRRIAVDVDLSKFFDRVNHDILMHHVSRHINDKRLLKLIDRYLRAEIDENSKTYPSTLGVPQGGPLSPLLSNILLDNLDKELEHRGHPFVRYADDFIILVKSERAGHRVLNSITCFLEKRSKLKVNTEKSQVVKTSQCQFLGFTFKWGKIQWHNNSRDKFKQEVRRLTNRNWGVSMAYQLFKLSQYLRGWINYYGIANAY